MNKNGWIGKALLVLAIVVPVVGLAFSVYFARTGSTAPQTPAGNTTQGEPYVLTAADFPESLDTGNQVGYRIPDFTLELDGTSVTSEGLVEKGRPTYLFFWATV